MTVTIEDIREAARLLEGQVIRTPLLEAPRLSELTGATVFVKCENQQFTNSFKDRGAFVKLASLSPDEKKKGVIAISAGNHAQAVAYHARRLQVPATIVMPETTPFTKVAQTKAHGARIIQSGETLADCQEACEAVIAEEGLTLVHPYDDDRIIAGQGTIALEMLADCPELDVIIAPIGGGGLIAGNAIAAKETHPGIEVIGVETVQYPSMYHAVRGEPGVCGGQTLADGIAVKNVTDRTVAICRSRLDSIHLVAESHIEQAVNAYLTLQKTCAEGAGAIGLALLMSKPDAFRGRRVGLILTGGNIDSRVLASIMFRELERQNQIVNVRVDIMDRQGVLVHVATIIGHCGANILEVVHRRMFLDVPAKGAGLEFMIETRDFAHATEIVDRLNEAGYTVELLDAPGGRESPSVLG